LLAVGDGLIGSGDLLLDLGERLSLLPRHVSFCRSKSLLCQRDRRERRLLALLNVGVELRGDRVLCAGAIARDGSKRWTPVAIVHVRVEARGPEKVIENLNVDCFIQSE
jgi:hypothetical protein